MDPYQHHEIGEGLLAQAEAAVAVDPAAAHALATLAQTHFVAAQSRAAIDGLAKTVEYLTAEHDRIQRYEAAAEAGRDRLARTRAG